MNTKNTFSISFYQRTDKIDQMNTAPIFMRVTVNGERAEIAVNRRFGIDRWENGKPKGTKDDAKELSVFLASLRERIYQIQRDLIEKKELVTAEKLKNRFHGKDEKTKTLIQAFEFHNKQVSTLVGKDYSPATLKRYETTLRHVKEFLKNNYKLDDMYLSEIKYEFITSFDFFLKTVRKCDHNSALKYIKNFRKVINMSVKHEWINKDPFQKFTSKLKEIERGFLTQDELNTIEKKKISIPRIAVVKDIFVFACYTGLAYAEVAKLTNDHIVNGIDGGKWISIRRTKTDNKSIIPLLPQAVDIIKKYKSENNPQNFLLPVLSNQKMNAYLKEISDICGISKTLTFHIARHTFATSVTLTNGVSIESVSAMLGHKSIRTTQIYSKVVEQKVSNDMNALKQKMQIEKNKKKNKSKAV